MSKIKNRIPKGFRVFKDGKCAQRVTVVNTHNNQAWECRNSKESIAVAIEYLAQHKGWVLEHFPLVNPIQIIE